MSTATFILSIIAFAALFTVLTLKYIHMFQLNSYKPPQQLKWMAKNKRSFIYNAVLAAAAVCICLCLKNTAVINLIMICLFAVGAVINRPKKAKKPLVYTNRVKRLLATEGVFAALSVLLTILFVPANFQNIIFAAEASLSPFIVLLCNYLNQPLEKSINLYYINDAKKIINNHKNLITVGVTGSYGKTSVKYILGTLLEAKYNVLITPESYNTPLGVVKTIRGSLRATHDIFVCEMGAKHVGDIKEICDIVYPDNGIITSVGPQHLETFKTLTNVKKTKFELADSLPANGILLVNGEDENISEHAVNYNCKKYGFSESFEYYASDISVSSEGTSFTVHHNGEEVRFTTILVGKHNVINLVGAIAMCCELGIKLQALPIYVKKVMPVPHRLQLIKRGATTVIDDAYNSNPAGAAAALEALSLFEGYKVLITPGMVELGERQESENYKFGCHAAEVCDFVALVGTQQTKSIYKGLKDSGFDDEKIFVTDSLNEAANLAFGMDAHSAKKVVLFENDLPDNY